MNASLRALLRGIVDYAGLFPPARLSLDTAFTNFTNYQVQREAWMLGRFICPAAKLVELGNYWHGMPVAKVPLTLSMLGTGGATSDEFLRHLDGDLQLLWDFRSQFGTPMQPDILELRLPMDVVAAGAVALGGLLDQILKRIQHSAPLRFYCEISLGPDWAQQVPNGIHALKEFNHGTKQPFRDGLKLRCGGVEKSAFPSIEQLALCLHQCVSHRVPFKATAGLHHPLPRFDPSVQTRMHGFINVFGGGLLAAVHRLNSKQLQEILADDDPNHFHFAEDRFAWRDYQVTTQEIDDLRRTLLISFGSCSFDEPRDDLRALGWL
jgi:hypothetical protein